MRELNVSETEIVSGGGPPPPEFPGVTDPAMLQSLYQSVGAYMPFGAGTGFGPGGDSTAEEVVDICLNSDMSETHGQACAIGIYDLANQAEEAEQEEQSTQTDCSALATLAQLADTIMMSTFNGTGVERNAFVTSQIADAALQACVQGQ